MHHHHGTGKVLQWSTAATLLFVVIETAAGFRAHSLALLSDAAHNFTDALALVLAAIGYYLQAKPADEVKTYGYQRAGVLAAFVNALTLLLIALVLVYEAWRRLLHPQAVDDRVMLAVAAIAVAVNGAIMWGLHRDQRHDINIRAAFIHMLGDALGAAAIVAGAVAIHVTGWLAIDPVLSILIAALIFWSAFGIIKETLNVLLEGLPRGIELKNVTGAMMNVDGVIDVHDLHIWTLGSNTHALSCHVLIEDQPPSTSNDILVRLNELLKGFAIHHTTIQFEHMRCSLQDGHCSILAGAPHHHSHHHR